MTFFPLGRLTSKARSLKICKTSPVVMMGSLGTLRPFDKDRGKARIVCLFTFKDHMIKKVTLIGLSFCLNL